jgi:hypothetical protein
MYFLQNHFAASQLLGQIELVMLYSHSPWNMAKNHLPWLMGKQSKLCLAENFRQVKSIGKRFNEILYQGCILGWR